MTISLDIPASASLIKSTRDFFRRAGWRGKTPAEDDLDGALIFPRRRRATSFDGTEIAYSTFGRQGPWVVLVPGYVCPDNFWKYLLPELEKRYRVVVYDLRGLGLSGTPRAPGHRARNLSPDDFSIPNQVRDVEAILDAEGIEQAALIGHSMGGQIVLEAYREIPARLSALVMLTAPYESPIRTFYGYDFSTVFRSVRTGLTFAPRPIVLLWRALLLVNPALTHQIAQFTRALGPDAKLEDMSSYYRHMAYLDPLVMLMMGEAMRTHSAADILSTVQVPTLVVAGERDMFTPILLAEHMRDEIPDSELVLIPGASHGAVIEKPQQVNEAIGSFLDRHLVPVQGSRK